MERQKKGYSSSCCHASSFSLQSPRVIFTPISSHAHEATVQKGGVVLREDLQELSDDILSCQLWSRIKFFLKLGNLKIIVT